METLFIMLSSPAHTNLDTRFGLLQMYLSLYDACWDN